MFNKKILGAATLLLIATSIISFGLPRITLNHVGSNTLSTQKSPTDTCGGGGGDPSGNNGGGAEGGANSNNGPINQPHNRVSPAGC